MATEGITIDLTAEGTAAIAETAADVKEKTVHIDADYVHSRLTDLAKDEDLSRYIL